MFEYLMGIGVIFFVWLTIFIFNKNLRKPMLWSGLVYFGFITLIHILFLVSRNFINIGSPITPGYWSPNTLFNLGKITYGYSIEDILFMFFVGGIATSIYEFILKKNIDIKKNRRHHIKALVASIVSFFVFGLLFKMNLIYSLIVSSFVGAISIWIERRDLVKHSLYGGISFVIIYMVGFLIFKLLFPNFISGVYNLDNLIGINFLDIPLEEYLYAFSFGLMWAPIYEYEHGSS